MSLTDELGSSPSDSGSPLAFEPVDGTALVLPAGMPPDGPEAWRLNGEAQRLSLVRGFERLLSWPSLRGVIRFDHQEKVAFRVLREMHGRAILADEVGLGKTIEAGLILKEYVLRGLVHRALILVPPSLATQWREEMREKFGLSFEILRSLADWERAPFLIASIDTAKRKVHEARTRDHSWDMVIVDEAHRLKNRTSQNWRFAVGLRKKYMLLLTATPVQNDLDELFNLVSLLTPGALPAYDEFLARFVATSDRRVPARVPELQRLLQGVMVRHRRGLAFSLPPRRVHSVAVRLSTEERHLYDHVTEFVRDAMGSSSGRMLLPARLTLTVLQREIGSSSFAAVQTLEKMTAGPLFSDEEKDRLAALRDEARAVQENVKARHLLTLLASTEEKVLVFTQYLRTLRYLQDLLEADGHSVAAYFGGLSLSGKDEAVRRFQGGTRVFLSTEAGGEGRNLQFARTLVNYDLPWNPLRIEQRIGRVHRLGQTREVHVMNLWALGTVEEYLIELLDRKIHMFELVVGELDLILGDLGSRRTFEELLMDLWVLRSSEDRRAALARLGDALVRARARYEEVKERNASVLGGLTDEARA